MLGDRICASEEECVFLLLSQPFWWGRGLKLHAFLTLPIKRETKTRNKLKRHAFPWVQLLGPGRLHQAGWAVTVLQSGCVSMHSGTSPLLLPWFRPRKLLLRGGEGISPGAGGRAAAGRGARSPGDGWDQRPDHTACAWLCMLHDKWKLLVSTWLHAFPLDGFYI